MKASSNYEIFPTWWLPDSFREQLLSAESYLERYLDALRVAVVKALDSDFPWNQAERDALELAGFVLSNPIKVKVFPSLDVNACCYYNGEATKIFVSSRVLELSPSQISQILFHEVAHAVHFAAGKRFSGYFRSHQQELFADRLSVLLTALTGLHDGSVWLDNFEIRRKNPGLALFSSHPSTHYRISDLVEHFKSYSLLFEPNNDLLDELQISKVRVEPPELEDILESVSKSSRKTISQFIELLKNELSSRCNLLQNHGLSILSDDMIRDIYHEYDTALRTGAVQTIANTFRVFNLEDVYLAFVSQALPKYRLSRYDSYFFSRDNYLTERLISDLSKNNEESRLLFLIMLNHLGQIEKRWDDRPRYDYSHRSLGDRFGRFEYREESGFSSKFQEKLKEVFDSCDLPEQAFDLTLYGLYPIFHETIKCTHAISTSGKATLIINGRESAEARAKKLMSIVSGSHDIKKHRVTRDIIPGRYRELLQHGLETEDRGLLDFLFRIISPDAFMQAIGRENANTRLRIRECAEFSKSLELDIVWYEVGIDDVIDHLELLNPGDAFTVVYRISGVAGTEEERRKIYPELARLSLDEVMSLLSKASDYDDIFNGGQTTIHFLGKVYIAWSQEVAKQGELGYLRLFYKLYTTNLKPPPSYITHDDIENAVDLVNRYPKIRILLSNHIIGFHNRFPHYCMGNFYFNYSKGFPTVFVQAGRRCLKIRDIYAYVHSLNPSRFLQEHPEVKLIGPSSYSPLETELTIYRIHQASSLAQDLDNFLASIRQIASEAIIEGRISMAHGDSKTRVPLNETLGFLGSRDAVFWIAFEVRPDMMETILNLGPEQFWDKLSHYWPERSVGRDVFLVKYLKRNFDKLVQLDRSRELFLRIFDSFCDKWRFYEFFCKFLEKFAAEISTSSLIDILNTYVTDSNERKALLDRYVKDRTLSPDDVMLIEKSVVQDEELTNEARNSVFANLIAGQSSRRKLDLLRWLLGVGCKPSHVELTEGIWRSTLDDLPVAFATSSSFRKFILSALLLERENLFEAGDEADLANVILEWIQSLIGEKNEKLRLIIKRVIPLILRPKDDHLWYHLVTQLMDEVFETRSQNKDLGEEEVIAYLLSGFGEYGIKLGQLLSINPIVREQFPGLAHALDRFKTNASMSLTEACYSLARLIRAGKVEHGAEIKVLGAASIKMVFLVSTAHSEKVVKVARSGFDARRWVGYLTEFIKYLNEDIADTGYRVPESIVDLVVQLVESERNLKNEEQLSKQLAASFPTAKVPKVLEAERWYVIEEYAPSARDCQLDANDKMNLGGYLFQSFFNEDAIFPYDLHPGNVGKNEEGQLIIYDPASVIFLTRETREEIARFVGAVIESESLGDFLESMKEYLDTSRYKHYRNRLQESSDYASRVQILTDIIFESQLKGYNLSNELFLTLLGIARASWILRES